ncbi:MAG: FAD-dependent thymidylate synthase [Candidatus Aenigmatarchaeota archaeon]
MPNISLINEDILTIQCIAAYFSQTNFKISTNEIINKVKEMSEKEKSKLIEKIVNSFGHNIIYEINSPAVIFDDISRFSMLSIWNMISSQKEIYGSGIETSLRLVKPENHVKEIDKNYYYNILEKYEKLIEKGIPIQDARYIIPEAATTRAIISMPSRYINKLGSTLKNSELKELKDIGENLSKIVKDIEGFEPKEEKVEEWKIFGNYESKESYMSFSKCKEKYSLYFHSEHNSLSSLAQLVRQRELEIKIEPVESIVRKRKFIIPPNFGKDAKEIYKEVAKDSLEKQTELLEEKNPNFVYYLLLGQSAEVDIYGYDKGIYNFCNSRICGTSQWEIRNLAIPVTKKLYELGKRDIGPKCYREKRCTEPSTFKSKHSTCPIYNKEKLDLIGCLEKLSSNYEILQL